MPKYPVTSGNVTIIFRNEDCVSVYDSKQKRSWDGNHDFGKFLAACDGKRSLTEIEDHLISTEPNLAFARDDLETLSTQLKDAGLLQFQPKASYTPIRIRTVDCRFGLDTVYVEPTRNCNLNCIHCYAMSPSYSKAPGAKEMDNGMFKTLLHELDEMGVMHCCFTGGEPFARDDFADLLETCHKMGMEPSIFTNGTILSPEHLSVLQKIQPRFVAVSLDSYKEDVYCKIRGKNMLPSVLKNLDALIAVGIRVRINCILFRGLNDSLLDIKNLLHLLKQHGITPEAITFDQFSPEGEGASKHFYQIDATSAIDNVRVAFEDTYQYDACPTHVDSAISQSENTFCGLGTSMLNITSSGKITPCPALQDKTQQLGTFGETPLSELWRSSSMLHFFREGKHIEGTECDTCEWFGDCKGGCKAKAFAKTGKFDFRDEWMCSVYGV